MNDFLVNNTYLLTDFLDDHAILFEEIKTNIVWRDDMATRKTASFGVAYNYSQMSYPYQEMPSYLKKIAQDMVQIIGFEPNNCLINYYPDGNSKMGFHSDQIDILSPNTGIVIVSLGENRILTFKNIENPTILVNYTLFSGSLFYMTQEVQKFWKHAIPTSK